MNQKIIFADEGYHGLEKFLKKRDKKKVFLVHGKSMSKLAIGQFLYTTFQKLNMQIVEFTGFEPNPRLTSAVEGTKLCLREKCDFILACGGGSAIDVAKCIRLFCELDLREKDFWENLKPGKLPFVVIPTTAGTGSEATHFAVLYHHGEKLSIGEKNNIPQAVIMDPDVLLSLPVTQKRATFLDAMCHAIESYWSIHATRESRFFSYMALLLIRDKQDDYFTTSPDPECRLSMLMAAYYAGKAINISKTTAGHAMSYKLTSYYGIPHGQAAMMCLTRLWAYMLRQGTAPRMEQIYRDLALGLGYATPQDAVHGLAKRLKTWGMVEPLETSPQKICDMLKQLVSSVNKDRLKNHPLQITKLGFECLYRDILEGTFKEIEGE